MWHKINKMKFLSQTEASKCRSEHSQNFLINNNIITLHETPALYCIGIVFGNCVTNLKFNYIIKAKVFSFDPYKYIYILLNHIKSLDIKLIFKSFIEIIDSIEPKPFFV